MAFIGSYFSYNGIPCTEFGLLIYDIDGNSQGSSSFPSVGEVQEDWVPSKGRSYFYGLSHSKPLQFKIVFGVDPDNIGEVDFLDRYEMDAIANWLTGHNERKWLEITQPDMESVRYKCSITGLDRIDHAWLPWAFAATVTCDSPYGYTYPMEFNYNCIGETEISLFSRSTLNQVYYPKLEIALNGSNTISIINQSCGNPEFKFTDLPRSHFLTISIDNDSGVISSSDSDYKNLYQYFNFNFLPLTRGRNNILVSGDCTLKFLCEFPVNFGG